MSNSNLLYKQNISNELEYLVKNNNDTLVQAIEELNIDKIHQWLVDQDQFLAKHNQFYDQLLEQHKDKDNFDPFYYQEQKTKPYKGMACPVRVKKVFNQTLKANNQGKSDNYYNDPYTFLNVINQPELALQFIDLLYKHNIATDEIFVKNDKDAYIGHLAFIYDNPEIIQSISEKYIKDKARRLRNWGHNKPDNPLTAFLIENKPLLDTMSHMLKHYIKSKDSTIYPEKTMALLTDQMKQDQQLTSILSQNELSSFMLYFYSKNNNWDQANYLKNVIKQYNQSEKEKWEPDCFDRAIQLMIEQQELATVQAICSNINFKQTIDNHFIVNLIHNMDDDQLFDDYDRKTIAQSNMIIETLLSHDSVKNNYKTHVLESTQYGVVHGSDFQLNENKGNIFYFLNQYCDLDHSEIELLTQSMIQTLNQYQLTYKPDSFLKNDKKENEIKNYLAILSQFVDNDSNHFNYLDSQFKIIQTVESIQNNYIQKKQKPDDHFVSYFNHFYQSVLKNTNQNSLKNENRPKLL